MRRPLLIVRHVKRNRLYAMGLLMAAVGLVGTGCGGVQGSHGVSPASFFLPGLIHHEVQEPRPDDAAPLPGSLEPGVTVAAAKPVAG